MGKTWGSKNRILRPNLVAGARAQHGSIIVSEARTFCKISLVCNGGMIVWGRLIGRVISQTWWKKKSCHFMRNFCLLPMNFWWAPLFQHTTTKEFAHLGAGKVVSNVFLKKVRQYQSSPNSPIGIESPIPLVVGIPCVHPVSCHRKMFCHDTSLVWLNCIA